MTYISESQSLVIVTVHAIMARLCLQKKTATIFLKINIKIEVEFNSMKIKQILFGRLGVNYVHSDRMQNVRKMGDRFVWIHSNLIEVFGSHSSHSFNILSHKSIISRWMTKTNSLRMNFNSHSCATRNFSLFRFVCFFFFPFILHHISMIGSGCARASACQIDFDIDELKMGAGNGFCNNWSWKAHTNSKCKHWRKKTRKTSPKQRRGKIVDASLARKCVFISLAM